MAQFLVASRSRGYGFLGVDVGSIPRNFTFRACFRMIQQLSTPAESPLAIVVLAAGLGKRMRSDLPKVVIGTREGPMIHHVLKSASHLSPSRIVVVAGHKREVVEEVVAQGVAASLYPGEILRFALQPNQIGTGDAVRAALPALSDHVGTVLILYGDVPLLSAESLRSFLLEHARSASKLSIVTTISSQSNPYGRVVRAPSGEVRAIVEARDCSSDQLRIQELNSGIYAVDASLLSDLIPRLTNQNAQREYYLTDIVGLAASQGITVNTFSLPDPIEVQGVNDYADLALIDRALQQRRNRELMQAGVRMLSPDTIWVGPQVQVEAGAVLGADISIEGESVVKRGAVIDGPARIDSCVLHEGAHLKFSVVASHAEIERDASVGPFAHLRPGTRLGREVKIGNFVETKNAVLDVGAKASHLSYLGDCEVGSDANIGAGTITCNYDGVRKSKTTIGKEAFIGSNSSLVAPVSIGAHATIGAGSVITKNVEEGSLALTRAPLTTKRGWGASRIKK